LLVRINFYFIGKVFGIMSSNEIGTTAYGYQISSAFFEVSGSRHDNNIEHPGGLDLDWDNVWLEMASGMDPRTLMSMQAPAP
jgi:hypothetical protein